MILASLNKIEVRCVNNAKDVENSAIGNTERGSGNLAVSHSLDNYNDEEDYMVRNLGALDTQLSNTKEEKDPEPDQISEYSIH